MALYNYNLIGGYELIKEKIDTTEKITININTIDLGYIDLLVSEGYNSTRTEFIETAIKMLIRIRRHDEKKKLNRY